MTRGGDEAAGPDRPPKRAGPRQEAVDTPTEGRDQAARAGEPSPAPLALGKADLPASDVLDTAKDVTAVPEKTREMERVEVEKGKVDLKLQKIVGYGALVLMFAQVIVANYIFILYGHKVGWANVPTGAMQAWLAATVVQVIGVVLVIARSVFPEGGRDT